MRRARPNSSALRPSFRRFVQKLFEPLEDRWLLASDAFVEFNLASNQPGTALVTDPSLGYAWGISTSPGGSGAFSVSDTFAGRSNSYSGDVAGSPFVNNPDQTVYVPFATGQVYNGNASEFIVHSNNPPPSGMTPTSAGTAEFLYASLDGTIYGFNASLGSHAVPAVSVPGAVFTGLTIASNGSAAAGGDQLFAANFLGGKIDVFDASFKPVTPSGSFTDPNLPAGYKPFNIQALGGDLYVSYAPLPVLPPGAGPSDSLQTISSAPAPGGVVDAFDANGDFLGRIASGSPLDQPWGMAIAPQSFGPFAGDLLVANHGDGKINVFDPTPGTSTTTGTSLGTLSDANGNPLAIDGLWGLSFGNGDNAGDASSLYFTAGSAAIVGQPLNGAFPSPQLTRGLVGTIQVTGTNPLVAVGTNTTAQAGEKFSGALAAFGSADLPSTTTPTATPAVSSVATYTATIDWGDGSSTTAGTVVPTGNGGFLVVGSHTYSTAGTDDYQVTIQDASGHSVTATGTVAVSAPPLKAHALPVVSHQLAIQNVAVATFVDTGGNDPLANYTATIDWGDGSTSSGIVTNGLPPAGSPLAVDFFSVAGSHAYTSAGDYTLGITINDTDGSQATVQGSVDIVQPTLLAHALPVHSDGLVVDNANVAVFSDTGGSDPITNYSATIDWGDGSTSTGTVSSGPTPADTPASVDFFTVAGSHTYTATGDYTFTVTLSDTDGSQATVQGTADVAQATLVAHALPVKSDGLAVNNATVAVFSDTGGPDSITNYSATIDWGDGSTSTGTVSNGPAPAGSLISVGFFMVAGSHTYAATGDYTFTVTLSDTDGSQTTVQGTADVAQATLVAHALPVKSDGLAVNNATVAAFSDTGGPDPITNYSATIDWGDGSSSTGTVSNGPAPAGSPISIGFFTVAGSHTYAATGDYTFTVTLSDTDGGQATVQGTADVAQATLVAHALPVKSDGLVVNNATVAAFSDTGGPDPITNYSATIDWGDGSSSTGTISNGPAPAGLPISIGFFTVVGSHTYAATGDYTFTVTIDDTDGSQTTVQGTADVAQATLKAHALPVKSDGLVVNNATVAAFSDTGGPDPLTNYSATIDWGDGSSSTGTVGKGPAPAGSPISIGFFTVAGSHTYAATGDYTFTVTLSDTDGGQATVQGTADVAQATLVAHALPVKSDGLAVNNATVAAFSDTGGPDPITNYSATIDWGDGSSSTGTVSNGPAPAGSPISVGFFTVAGSHTYAATGDYTFTVTIDDTDGSQTTVQGTADVAQATLKAHALPVVGQGLSVSNAEVAGFIDTGGADPLTNYSATIDWGDGSSSTGTVGSLATPASTLLGDLFTVSGSHTYASAGDYTFTVAISDSDGSQATVQGTVDVAEPTLVAHALPVISQGLTLNNASVADFIDTGGADPLTNYSATIDWGDGSSSTGTVSAAVAGSDAAGSVTGSLFSVAGSHTYASKGDYAFTVTISDTDGVQATVQGTADVAQAPLLAVGVPVVVTSGLAVNGAIVAAFSDAGGGDASSNYSATIDWGDGSSTTAGTVSGSGNSFVVTGSHTYAAAGDYHLQITIADQDGSAASAQSHAFIDSSSASFVASAFQDVLHRAADDAGLSYWTQQIGAGLAASQFASDLAHSAEYYATNVIDPAYQKFLGRSADAAGVAYWTNQMQQGLTDQQIEAEFIASPEFYANSGGTNSSWVNAMYQIVLGRGADSGGLNYWLAQLSAGESRSGVALGFAGSQEHDGQLVQNDYFAYLGRSAGASEVNYWVAQFENGATNEDVVSGFVGSNEFVKLHS